MSLDSSYITIFITYARLKIFKKDTRYENLAASYSSKLNCIICNSGKVGTIIAMKLYKTKSPQYVCVKNRWKWWMIEGMDHGSTTSQFCSISPNWNKIHDKKQNIFYRFISFYLAKVSAKRRLLTLLFLISGECWSQIGDLARYRCILIAKGKSNCIGCKFESDLP